MKLNPDKMAFGRHETFALRYGWLSKGFQNLLKTPGILESDDATVVLGVGRNMVTSIRYWLRACQMISPVDNTPTELGNLLLTDDGFDPYLEDEATIWLLHWLLVTNSEQATSLYWFFCLFHKAEFTVQELATALTDFANDKMANRKKVSSSTLKNDAALICRMYTQSKADARAPLEDALDSPFSLLGLVHHSSASKLYQSRPAARSALPLGVLGFAVCQLFEEKQLTAIPMEDFMYSRENLAAPGAVFRLSESDLVAKLERLVDFIPGVFEIRDTAGQHQLYMIAKRTPIDFLVKHYHESLEGIAA